LGASNKVRDGKELLKRKLEEKELAVKARSGDKSAFGELVKRFERKVYALAYRFTGNREDASDAMQEAFLQAWKKIGSFRGDSSFSTWLYRITVNVCLMKKRKKTLTTVSADRPAVMADSEEISREPVDWSDDPMATLANSELKRKLDSALLEMPEEYRQAVVLKDIDGMRAADAAKALNISLAALKSRLHRGRLFLRGKLSAYFEGRGK